MALIEIKDLQVAVGEKKVLNGLSLLIKSGEVHAIMGPNGSGKSSLSKVIAGHPSFQVLSGSMRFMINRQMKNLVELSPEERAREGLFLAYQYPIEIPGVENFEFLRSAFNSVCRHHGVAEMDIGAFRKFLQAKLELLGMREEFLFRGVNVGFSGGEKKRNEILQMAVLSPRLAILDEIDSGLDIDALKAVAKGVNALRAKDRSFLLITHYQRLLQHIEPDFVHVLVDGKIVESGDRALAHKLEEKGYDWLLN